MKIKEIYGNHDFLAFYNPDQDTIYYDKSLNRFPKFKQFVIDHEKSHARDYPNVLKIIKRDLVDYYIGRKLFWNERKLIIKEKNEMFNCHDIPLGYKVFAPILAVYALLLNFYFANKSVNKT